MTRGVPPLIVMSLGSEMARRSGLECEGINLFLADGERAMQEVLHCHIHVFPRFAGDGFRLRFGAHYHFVRPARWELDAAAERLRSILSDLR